MTRRETIKILLLFFASTYSFSHNRIFLHSIAAAHEKFPYYKMANDVLKLASSEDANQTESEQIYRKLGQLVFAQKNGSWGTRDPNIDRVMLPVFIDTYLILQKSLPVDLKNAMLSSIKKALDYQIRTYPPYKFSGRYGNQDLNYALIMAMGAKLFSSKQYFEEAVKYLDIYHNSSMYYYVVGTNPQATYQHMCLVFAARFLLLAETLPFKNDHIINILTEIIEEIESYYRHAYLPNASTEYSSASILKDHWMVPGTEFPNAFRIISKILRSKCMSDIADTARRHFTKLQVRKWRPMPYIDYVASLYKKPVELNKNARDVRMGIFYDKFIKGFRGKWDNFMATITTTPLSSSFGSCFTVASNGRNSTLGYIVPESFDTKYRLFSPPPLDKQFRPTKYFHSNIDLKVPSIEVMYTPQSYHGWLYTKGNEGLWYAKQHLEIINSGLKVVLQMKCTKSGTGRFARIRFSFLKPLQKIRLSKYNDYITGSYGNLKFEINYDSESCRYRIIDFNELPNSRIFQRKIITQSLLIELKRNNWSVGDTFSLKAAFFH